LTRTRANEWRFLWNNGWWNFQDVTTVLKMGCMNRKEVGRIEWIDWL
jgi:hypothetical protein